MLVCMWIKFKCGYKKELNSALVVFVSCRFVIYFMCYCSSNSTYHSISHLCTTSRDFRHSHSTIQSFHSLKPPCNVCLPLKWPVNCPRVANIWHNKSIDLKLSRIFSVMYLSLNSNIHVCTPTFVSGIWFFCSPSLFWGKKLLITNV